MPSLNQSQYDQLLRSGAIIADEISAMRLLLASAQADPTPIIVTPDSAVSGTTVSTTTVTPARPSATPLALILAPNWKGITQTEVFAPAKSFIQNPQLLTVDPTVLYQGHPTLRANQPAFTDSTPQCSLYFPNGATYKDLWVRLVIQFSKGWTTDGVTTGGRGYKFMALGWDGLNGRSTIEYVNTNQYNNNWDVVDATNAPLSEVVAQNSDHTTTEWSDQQPVTFYWHYRHVSDASIQQSFWLDKHDTGLVLQSVITGKMLTGTVPRVNRWDLLKNFNATRRTAQSLWICDYTVVDGSGTPNPFNLPGV